MVIALRKLALLFGISLAVGVISMLLVGRVLPRGAQLAYVAGSDDNSLGRVYLMDISRGITQVILRYAATGCTWSPDGKLFTFSAFQTGTVEIYLLDMEHLQVQNFTRNNHWDGFASWSPDGKQVVFSSNTDDQGEIYTADWAGEDLQLLVGGNLQPGNPAWSPDGERVAFLSYQFANPSVFVMDPIGNNIRPVTNSSIRARTPSWSPDSRWLTFWGVGEGRNGIYRMDAHCNESAGGCVSQAQRLFEARNVRAGANPVWSPDGRYIAFTTHIYGSATIYSFSEIIWLVTPEGKVRRLTDYSAYDTELAWSPDSTALAFVSDTERDTESLDMVLNELYLVTPEGQHRRLTFNDSKEWCLAWRP